MEPPNKERNVFKKPNNSISEEKRKTIPCSSSRENFLLRTNKKTEKMEERGNGQNVFVGGCSLTFWSRKCHKRKWRRGGRGAKKEAGKNQTKGPVS